MEIAHTKKWVHLKSTAILWTLCVLALLVPFCLLLISQPCKAQSSKQVDKIRIEKSKRTMSLLSGKEVLKTYKVALGSEPVGAKDRQGDHKTPEGAYSVDRKLPNSQFHKALHISYPSPADREHAHKLGVSPGGDVEIHGLGAQWGWVGSRHTLKDWTDGCIAVTNEEIDEIYLLVRTGTPVEILP